MTTHPIEGPQPGAARRLVTGTLLGATLLTALAGPVEAAPSVKTRIKGPVLTVSGSAAADVIVLRLAGGDPTVLEIDAQGDGSADFSVPRARFDRIEVVGAGGADTITIDESNGAFTDDHPTALDGGSGNDVLTAGSGSQVIFGGTGNDIIDGGPGADAVDAGPGDDTITWQPGSYSDYAWGGVGFDTLVFTGGNVDEQLAIAHVGSIVRITRNVDSVAMHLEEVERLEVSTLGGTDTVTVDDLAGAGVTDVAIELAVASAGDGTPDTVIVNGSAGDDVFSVAAVGGGVGITRSGTAAVRLHGADPALDALVVNGLAGDDQIDILAGVEALVQVVANP